MIKLENYEVMGWEHAIRGMRNPMNSWEKGDSHYCGEYDSDCEGCPAIDDEGICTIFDADSGITPPIIGPNDHELMMKLAKGGSVHAKYRRMITVYVDITAPLYWWKEFDTYKVGTVANSCSTMHKIHDKEFTLEDFSCEHLADTYGGIEYGLFMPISSLKDRSECFTPSGLLSITIDMLNICRNKYNETKIKPMKDESKRKRLLKVYFDQMIQLLPSSYNQKRTVMLNYEVLVGIYKWRKNHKLDCWRDFCKWIETLPYSEIITSEDKDRVEVDNNEVVNNERSPYHPMREDVTGGESE